MSKIFKAIVLFFLLVGNGNVFSQEKGISKEILDESCDCISKIDMNLSKASKNDSIKSCITTSIVMDQTKEMMQGMLKKLDTLKSIKGDTTIIVSDKPNIIIGDKNYDGIQEKLMADCPYLKALIQVNNEKHKNSTSDKKKAKAFYDEGEKYFNQQKIELALVEFNKAVKSDPKFAFAWDNLGICYRKLNRFKEAINCYEKSLELDPKGKVPLMNMAVAYELLNNKQKAIDIYNKFIALHPDDAEGFYGIARLQSVTKDYENALENGFKAFEIYSNTSSPYAQDAITVMKEVVRNLKEENKIKVFNDFAEKHGIEKIKE